LLSGAPTEQRQTSGGGVVAGPGGEIVRQTPDPAAVFTPRPEEGLSVEGTLLFVKSGNVWAAHERGLQRLTDTGRDSTPAWTPDGRRIYLIEGRSAPASVTVDGQRRRYDLEYPLLVAVDPRGQRRTVIKDSLYSLGSAVQDRFFTWILQPDVSPDGTTIALVSDWPDPLARDPTLSLLPADGGEIRNLDLPSRRPFGHNDPAWSPDGATIAYTYDDRLDESATGAPRLVLYSIESKAQRALTGPGYSQPQWSPDGHFIVCVRGHDDGRDLVVLDVAEGREVARLTRDGSSFAPAWSPSGHQIAYLHAGRDGIDLRILTLASNGALHVTDDKAVTTGSGLDPASPPAWFVPPTTGGRPTR
jgi:Tol biopolymer transport system component